VRHELLPLLERDFNPSVLDALSNSAELAREEQQFWDATVCSALNDLQLPNEMFDAARFRLLHIALQRRALIAIAETPLDFAHIERAREFILASQVGEREIARGLRISLVRDSAGQQSFGITSGKSSACEYSVVLALPGVVELPAPRKSRLIARVEIASRPGTGLDASLEGRTLTVRNWRPGDRFQPFGRGEGKVKDFFQQIHVPAIARSTWPVAELEGDIVWVLGLPVSARFAVKDKKAIVIEELPSFPGASQVVEDVTSQDVARSRK
jgi:tRNA(Ile)-lysidine synthase